MATSARIIVTVLFVGLLHRWTDGALTCRVTGSATMGPFFKRDQPQRKSMCQRDPRYKTVPKLTVSGLILDEECNLPVERAKIEVWQADSTGNYRDASWCRSTLYSNCRGEYTFRTVYPGKYSLGRSFRPAHIHFMVTTPDNCYNRLITQLYFEGDTNLGPYDPCSSSVCNSGDESLIHSLSKYTINNTQWISTEFNIVLKRHRNWDSSKCVPQCPTENELTTTPATTTSATKTPATTQKPTTVNIPQELTTSLPVNCPDINGSQVLNQDLFDFVFRVTVKNKRLTEDGHYKAKLNEAFTVPQLVSEFFAVGQLIKLECLADCNKVCNQTLLSKQSFVVAGVADQLSNQGVIILSGTSLIQPWKLVKREMKKTFNG